jgi:hypothetical protein
MNRDRDFEATAVEWLNAGSDTTPPHLIDAVLLAVRSTPQERDSRIPLRTPSMTFFMRVAAAVAVVAVAGVAALYALGAGPNLGSGPPAGLTTQPTPTQPPAASPSQPLGGRSGCVDLYDNGGTYRATVGTLSLAATIPAGWTGVEDQVFLHKAPCLLGSSLRIEASLVSQVYSDTCYWRGAAVETTTPDAVTAALAAQEGHETIGPTNVTIGGRSASRFELLFPADFNDDTSCDDGMMWLFPGDPDPGIFNVDPGTTVTVYVVDVNGVAVAVVASVWTEDATPANIAELDAVVDSFRFEPSG